MKNIVAILMEQYHLMVTSISAAVYRMLMICIAFVAPITGILITVIVCIFADTILGVWKAKKLKERITSRKLSQLISKMLLYEATIVLIFLIDKFILNG